MWAVVLGEAADSLQGGRLRVVDGGGQTAEAAFDEGFPRVEMVTDDAGRQAARVTVQATFPAGEANFEWAAREVLTREGIVLDRLEQDHGRKAAGSEWALEAALDLAIPGA